MACPRWTTGRSASCWPAGARPFSGRAASWAGCCCPSSARRSTGWPRMVDLAAAHGRRRTVEELVRRAGAPGQLLAAETTRVRRPGRRPGRRALTAARRRLGRPRRGAVEASRWPSPAASPRSIVLVGVDELDPDEQGAGRRPRRRAGAPRAGGARSGRRRGGGSRSRGRRTGARPERTTPESRSRWTMSEHEPDTAASGRRVRRGASSDCCCPLVAAIVLGLVDRGPPAAARQDPGRHRQQRQDPLRAAADGGGPRAVGLADRPDAVGDPSSTGR